MKTEVNILDYLSPEEVKEVMLDELRVLVRGHFKDEKTAERLLSNLAYGIVQDEVDKICPNYHGQMVEKVADAINKDLSYHVWRYNYNDNQPQSYGAKLIEQTVKESQQLIKDKVIETIKNKDYSEDAWAKFEKMAESFGENLYDFMATIQGKR
jgi:hypothetical protein